MPNENFTPAEVLRAWQLAEGRCECCGKKLSFSSQGKEDSRSPWEAHRVGGRSLPVILCIGGPENCHLNCGHRGNYERRGITPTEHVVPEQETIPSAGEK